jgi:spore maturation protein CgeB
MAKKIVIIGSDHIAALEMVYKKNLIQKGHAVSLFPAQTLFLSYYNSSLINKVIYRIGLSRIEREIQNKLKTHILTEKPEIVIVFKGMEIIPRTLKWIRNKGIKLYNYNPDSPIIFSGRGSGNKNVTNSISLFDIYFTYDWQISTELVKMGVRSELIPFGFDCDGFKYCDLREEDEVLKLCFVGNADKFRIEFIQDLARNGVEIDVFGENWTSLKLHPKISAFGPLYGEQFWKTLQRYSLQLNMLRPHNLTSHNMRSFDIPGAGGILIAPRTIDHETFFSEGEEILLFSNIDELIDKVNNFINLSFNDRNKIRQAARVKALKSHTYSIRTNKLIEFLEK